MSSTVVSRTFRSTPHRDALVTWNAIVDMLTHGKAGEARTALLAVGGVAASVIADQAPKDAAIVVTCDGPRTRVYCLYDDDAIDGSDANEDSLGFDPLKGDWHVSLPCTAEDLDWVQAALKNQGSRISARDLAEAVTPEAAATAKVLTLDPKGFLGS
jgi:hypothetical protein